MVHFAYLAVFEEDVLRLHVTVQDLALVQVEEGEGHLGEPVDDLGLCKVLALALVRLDLRVNVATVAVHHHDV